MLGMCLRQGGGCRLGRHVPGQDLDGQGAGDAVQVGDGAPG